MEVGGDEEGNSNLSGGVGRGTYELIFWSPVGPNFRDIKDLAFDSEGYGIAVGDDTTVVICGHNSYIEKTIDYQFTLTAADPNGGFWACAGDPLGLFYRPRAAY